MYSGYHHIQIFWPWAQTWCRVKLTERRKKIISLMFSFFLYESPDTRMQRITERFWVGMDSPCWRSLFRDWNKERARAGSARTSGIQICWECNKTREPTSPLSVLSYQLVQQVQKSVNCSWLVSKRSKVTLINAEYHYRWKEGLWWGLFGYQVIKCFINKIDKDCVSQVLFVLNQ